MAEEQRTEEKILCLRCQTELEDRRPFCDDCLRIMEAYPVKPNTVVMLPRRNGQEPSKKQPHRKRPPSAEEQVVQLKKLLHRMIACAVLLLAVLCLMTAWLVRELKEPAAPLPVGRNYTITTDQTD